jgi:isopenicillin N synthase-like dioxygenase
MALKALSIGMPGVPVGYFEDYHSDFDNQLRFLHCMEPIKTLMSDPSAPRSVFDSGEKGRISAHTDFGTCTFLMQDDVGGLQVEDPHRPGTFVDAPPIPGTLVFNIG